MGSISAAAVLVLLSAMGPGMLAVYFRAWYPVEHPNCLSLLYSKNVCSGGEDKLSVQRYREHR